MKILMMILTTLLTLSIGQYSVAALNNQNNPQKQCVTLGSLSADGVVQMGGSGAKKIQVTAVELVNAAAIAASDTDYVILELKKGSTIVAEIDSRAAHENGIANGAVEALNLVSESVSSVAAASVLTVNYNETDAGTNVALTSAILCMHYYVK